MRISPDQAAEVLDFLERPNNGLTPDQILLAAMGTNSSVALNGTFDIAFTHRAVRIAQHVLENHDQTMAPALKAYVKDLIANLTKNAPKTGIIEFGAIGPSAS